MRSLFAIALYTLLGFGSAYAAYPLEVNHAGGKTVIEATPKRVIVFDIAALDSLHTLGEKAIAVADGYWPSYLNTYSDEQYPKVGSLFEPDYEKVKALKPDLIIVANRSRSAYDSLSEIAPTIDLSIPAEDFVNGVKGNLTTLGEIFNKQHKALQLNKNLDDALKSLQMAADKSQVNTALVLFTVKGNIIPHAPGERFGMFYEMLGTTSVAKAPPPAEAGRTRPAAGSPEAQAAAKARQQRLQDAMAQSPNLFIVLDRDSATGGEGNAKQTLANNPDIADSAAWQNNAVFYLNPTEWYIATGGYQSVMNTLTELSQML